MIYCKTALIIVWLYMMQLTVQTQSQYCIFSKNA